MQRVARLRGFSAMGAREGGLMRPWFRVYLVADVDTPAVFRYLDCRMMALPSDGAGAPDAIACVFETRVKT
jgi:hypothetical protein